MNVRSEMVTKAGTNPVLTLEVQWTLEYSAEKGPLETKFPLCVVLATHAQTVSQTHSPRYVR